MPAQRIEALLTGAGVKFERVNERTWELTPGPTRSIEGTLVWITGSFRKTGDLLKIHSHVGSLPEDADVKFFQDIFRKNRDMGHGGFALIDNTACCYVDTLELEGCEQNDMDATLDWLTRAGDVFRQKLDRAKLPYIET
ncbi:MAG: hypothetical protein WCX65_16060 [bacterium]